MLQTITYLILINIITVIVIDGTDFPSTLKKALTYIFTKGKAATDNYRFHLFDCSLCVCWWLSILYVIFTGSFSIPMIAICLLSALFTKQTLSILLFIQDLVDTIINILNKLLKLINKK